MRTMSVVMLVRDRLRLTQQALESLAFNSFIKSNLVLVDDASQPETKDWLAGWAERNTQTTLIRNNVSKGTGWARNAGIAMARTVFGEDNLLYLSDNDTYFLPGWDEAIIAAHERFEGFKIIGGGCHPFLQPHDTPYLNIGEYKLTSRDAVSGYSWLLDWQTWDEFGPLDAHALGVRQSEDWAMCQKVRKAGYFVGSIVPEMVIHAGITDTFGEHPPGWEIMRDNRMKGILYE